MDVLPQRVNKMVGPEPQHPVKPEENDNARFELIKAMGVAIAAIAKEKGVFITTAEVQPTSNDYFEMTLKAVIPDDKKTGDEYNDACRKYYNDHREWELNLYCEKFGMNAEQYESALQEYNKYCRDTNYDSRISKMKWFESNYTFFEKNPIIEVA